MRRHAHMARGDDTVPYDRELIRSGGTRARDRRRQAVGPPRRPARQPGVRGPGGSARRLRTLLVVVLLVVIVGIVLLGVRAAAFNATVTDTPFVSTALLGPLNGSDRVNVMLVGYGGAEHEGAFLADSIQVLSIDPAKDETTTIPIPRDLWVEGLASFPQNGKVNEVFAIGHAASGRIDDGAVDLAQVVSEITGLEIRHWLAIDFQGFEEMVDAVGGATVDNPTNFCWTTIEAFHEAGQWTMGCFEQGPIELDGPAALAYARARYTSDVSESTDYARSARQGRIMAALRAKLGDGGLGSIAPGLGLMSAAEGRVRTDLSVIDLFLLSGHLASDRRLELAEGPVVVATTNTIGQYILIPTGWTGPGDYGGIHAYLAAELEAPIGAGEPNAP